VSLVASEPIFAKRSHFCKRIHDSGDFGLRIRGIFVFGEHKVSFMFQFRRERKVGVCAAGDVARFGLRVAKEGRRGWGRRWYVAGCSEERDWDDGSFFEKPSVVGRPSTASAAFRKTNPLRAPPDFQPSQSDLLARVTGRSAVWPLDGQVLAKTSRNFCLSGP